MNERAIFIAALEKDDPAARDDYLQLACAGNPALRQRIERLLKLYGEPDSFLQLPDQAAATVASASIIEGPSAVIGPYKLLEQLGEGGFGVVFMAEQEKPIRRKVALKIIKPSMDSKQVVARFEAERQALALMDHPHIARVLDGGTTESGRPYFVMELVKGIPITEFCDKNRLTPRERLELFIPVCQAVQHAHQKGIIHRDLKPSNVLVTMYDDKPVPKVIDFGVAKAIEQKLTEQTLFTRVGQIVGTLEYMSPEQATLNALDVDTRSDIYSLGVLLYELLTGTTPLDKNRLQGVAFLEMLRRIREEEPPRPSTRLTESGDALTAYAVYRGTEITPAQIAALNMANDAMQVPESSLFAAGDVRANENIELTAIQTLFVRNHNRLADELHVLHPAWTDEQLYQEARKLNIATEEMITYNEFLPAILGPNALPAYTGYQANVNASIATEFSTVGFRFGHSLLSNSVGRVNNDGTAITDPTGNAAVNLTQDFFDPNLIGPNGLVDPLTGHVSTNIGAILKADASNTANELDLLLIDEIRNQLFGIPNAPGTDLAARDIQRARDNGIGTYNQVRVAYGLPAVTDFSQITSNVTVQNELKATYGTVDQIDPFEGMLAEDHLPGADVGPTIKAILVKQFTALRDGDRFFYLNKSFTTQEVNLIRQAPTLAGVIKANTGITNLQSNVFFFKVSISGTVFNDVDDDGFPRTRGEPGLAGITVNLNDDSGNVVATTTTDSQGHYEFTDQTGIPGTGNFTVSIVLPAGDFLTAPAPGTIRLSRGGLNVDGVNFAVDPPSGAAAMAVPNTANPISAANLPAWIVATSNGSFQDVAPGSEAVVVQTQSAPTAPSDGLYIGLRSDGSGEQAFDVGLANGLDPWNLPPS